MLFEDDEMKLKWWEWPWYRIILRIPYWLGQIKYIFQRAFRKHHCSDPDLWGLYYRIAEIVLPKLKAFYELEFNGIPIQYCSAEDIQVSEEEYQKEVDAGRMFGGGEEKRREHLREVIFAMDYIVNGDEWGKKRDAFFKRWDIEDPHAEIEKNKNYTYIYEGIEGIMWSSTTPDKMEDPDWIFKKRRKDYYNPEQDKYIRNRVENGLELFGKIFYTLGD